MGLNWKGALEKGFDTAAQGFYRRHEYALKEEEAQANLVREEHMEILRNSNAKEMNIQRASLLEQGQKNQEERAQKRMMENRVTPYLDSNGMPMTAGQLASIPEEERAGLKLALDKQIEDSKKLVLANIDIEDTALKEKSIRDDRRVYDVLVKNGEIDPTMVSFDEYHSKSQLSDLLAKKGLPDDIFKEYVKMATESWKEFPTSDPNGYKLYTSKYKSPGEAQAAYTSDVIKGLATTWKGNQPASSGERAKAVAQDITLDQIKQMSDDQGIAYVAQTEDLPADKAAEKWMKYKAALGITGGAKIKELPKIVPPSASMLGKPSAQDEFLGGGSLLGENMTNQEWAKLGIYK